MSLLLGCACSRWNTEGSCRFSMPVQSLPGGVGRETQLHGAIPGAWEGTWLAAYLALGSSVICLLQPGPVALSHPYGLEGRRMPVSEPESSITPSVLTAPQQNKTHVWAAWLFWKAWCHGCSTVFLLRGARCCSAGSA